MGGISLLAGLGSSIVSSVQAKKANEAARQEYNQKTGMLDNWFNRQYYSDITKRTDVQNMLRLLQENQQPLFLCSLLLCIYKLPCRLPYRLRCRLQESMYDLFSGL